VYEYGECSFLFKLLRPILPTTRFNTEKLYMLITFPLCVVYGSQNKLQLSSYIYLTIWFCITEVGNVYCAVRNESLYETDYISSLKYETALL
jgi:hypothetical protein